VSVVAAFDRAADYDRHAVVQQSVAKALADRIVTLPLPPAPRVLEIGCGTGALGSALVDRLPRARWLMTDIAPAMVERTRSRFAERPAIRFAAMDGEHPNTAERFDLICSSLAMQWFTDLAGAIARLRAQLTPRGKLAFTTLAAGTFIEWRRAHPGLTSGTYDYPSPDDLAGLGLEVAIEKYEVRHSGAREFLCQLKALGAATPRTGHRPLSPAQLRQVMARFEAMGAAVTYVVATCLSEPPA